MHSGDFKSAHVFFKAGYERCPEYPMAAEHLAEIEGRLGHLKRASELYEEVIKQTDHPEFIAALAEIYIKRGLHERAQALIKRADLGFKSLFKRMPEAISGHAADFYLGLGGSISFALELLTRNHQLRPNVHSKQKLAEALIAHQRLDEATHMIKETLVSPIEFAEKYWTAARLALACHQPDEAKRLATHALNLNPRIADLEGALPLD